MTETSLRTSFLIFAGVILGLILSVIIENRMWRIGHLKMKRQTMSSMRSIYHAVTAYHSETRRWPLRPGTTDIDLNDERLLPFLPRTEARRDSWGNPIRVSVETDSLLVQSSGADGAFEKVEPQPRRFPPYDSAADIIIRRGLWWQCPDGINIYHAFGPAGI